MRIPLTSNDDSLYVGTFFVGTPAKPIKAIIDTGSEHMAISSDLCTNCPSKAYSLAQSTSKKLISNDTKSVIYGSAKFEGKETQDHLCL